MEKLSKSDKLDKDEEARIRDDLMNPKAVCQHFATGTWVVTNNRRGKVLAKGHGVMFVQYEDGATEILRPYALLWER